MCRATGVGNRVLETQAPPELLGSTLDNANCAKAAGFPEDSIREIKDEYAFGYR